MNLKPRNEREFLQVEWGLLGTIIHSPEIIPELIDRFGIRAATFRKQDNADLFEAAVEVFREKGAVKPNLAQPIAVRLGRNPRWHSSAEVLDVLDDITMHTPVPSPWREMAEILKRPR